MTETGLEYLSNVQDLVDLHEFMQDDDLAKAMNLAVKCIAKPDLPPAHAREALVRMQALAFKFKMQGQVYMTIKQGKAGTDENKKKNVYFAASEQCEGMASVLKYIVRNID